MSNVLDLSSGNLGAFDLADSGWKDVIVQEVTDIVTDNEDGKLPVGTPGYNIQFKIEGGGDDGKSVFNRFYFPPEDYDEAKRKLALGRFADFLLAAGYSEKDVMGGKFKFDKDDVKGRQLRILVGQKDGYNTVRNFKPVGGTVEDTGLL